ncbi:Conserved_hypothetical protein [Hexamita inflata]|uniref:Uncharacterized protein n=1 Tax=Hexamita inflata TaxID=28002 RepID=A0ABP1JU58_9EUKA
MMIDNQQYNYCKKSKQINNILIQNQIYMSNYVTSTLFINTQSTQKSKLDVNIHNNDMNQFSLFGLSTTQQQVVDSRINVTLSFSVLSAALICTTCDVLVRGSTLIFIASGQQLSGAILTPVLSAQFEHSFIQFRLNSSNSSGLVNVVKNALHLFAISNCFVTGYNYVKSDYNGIASSLVAVEITLNVDQLTICANQQKLFGSESITMNQVGTETLSCDVCNTSVLVYGICSDGLQFGVEVEGMLQCVFPFEYIENQCTCARGYLLNITHCSNVVDNLTDISRLVGENYNELNGSVTDIYSTMHNIDSNIVKNYTTVTLNQLQNQTQLENMIVAKYNSFELNQLNNVSLLDNRIHTLISDLSNSLASNISTLGSQITANLVANSSKLEQYITGNYSQVNAYLALNTSTLDLKINSSFNSLNGALANNISSLNSSSIASLVANSSKLEQYIASNYSSANGLLLANTNTLDSRIQSNFTSLNNSLVNNISALANQSISGLKANSSKLEQYIIGNFTVSDTNIKTNVSNLELKLSNSINQLNSSLAGNISQLNSTILANLKQNSSNIELFIQSNYSKVNGNLLANASLLDSRIQSNFTSFNSSLASNISTLGSQITANLVANSSKLEQYITGNYSQVNAYLALNTSTLDLKINSSFNSLNGALANNISSLNSSSIASLVANSSKLEQYIASNYSSANGLLLANTNTLDSRIQSNFTSLNNSLVNNISALANQSISGLKANSSKLEQYIIGNFTVSDTNIKTNVSNLELKLSNSINQLNSSLAGNISQLNSTILANLKQNSSNIELFIQSNYSKVNGNLLANASLLDSRIQSNFTSFNSSLASNISTLGSQITANLVANSSKLEQYITGNYSQVNAYLALNTSTLDLKINSSFNSLNGALASNISSLNSSSIASLVANSSKLEQYIASNYSSANGLLLANTNTLDSRIQSNFTSLNNSLVNNISALANQSISGLKANSSKLEQYIIGNQSQYDLKISTTFQNIENYLINNSTILDNILNSNISKQNLVSLSSLASLSSKIEYQLLQNISITNTNIITNFTALNKRLSDNLTLINSSLDSINTIIQQLQVEQNCTNQYGYKYVEDVCVLSFCTVLGQTIVNDACQCAYGYHEEQGICVQSEFEVQFINDFVCTGNSYIFIISIQSVPTPFVITSGHIFSSEVTNAWIQIPDTIFTQFSPIFSQTVFYNIKIEIGQQLVSGGNILNSGSTVDINKVSIVSKPGSLINSSTNQFNILQTYSTNTYICDLLININMQYSSSNVSLIFIMTNIQILKNYQLLGNYASSGTISLMGIQCNSATVTLHNLNMRPQTFNSGNYSSIMFSYIKNSFVNSSSIIIIIKNEQVQPQLANIIFSTSDNQYSFGGLAMHVEQTKFNVYNSIFQCYQQFDTSFVYKYGLLFGLVYQNLNSILLQQICVDFDVVGVNNTMMFGLIGNLQSKLQIQQSSVYLYASGKITYAGIIGGVSNVNASIATNQLSASVVFMCVHSGAQMIGALVGYLQDANCFVSNTKFMDSSISVDMYAGGVVGVVFIVYLPNTLNLVNVELENLALNSSSGSGGFVGAAKSVTVKLTHSKIKQTAVSAENCFGIVLGKDLGGAVFVFDGSNSNSQNKANGTDLTECVLASVLEDGC